MRWENSTYPAGFHIKCFPPIQYTRSCWWMESKTTELLSAFTDLSDPIFYHVPHIHNAPATHAKLSSVSVFVLHFPSPDMTFPHINTWPTPLWHSCSRSQGWAPRNFPGLFQITYTPLPHLHFYVLYSTGEYLNVSHAPTRVSLFIFWLSIKKQTLSVLFINGPLATDLWHLVGFQEISVSPKRAVLLTDHIKYSKY